MTKIAIVMHDMRGGGAEKMMVRLANQFADDGDDVELITISEGGVNKAHLQSNVKLTELSCLRTLTCFLPLRRALKTSDPDVVLSVLTHINVITSLVCASLGWLSKLSVSERNAFSLDKNVSSDRIMNAAYLLAPYVYRVLPKPVICVSNGVAEDLVQTTCLVDKNVTSLPNPVITEEVKSFTKSPATHEWLVNKNGFVIVGVGRLSFQKGFDMLLDALQLINQSIQCRLILFGEGELRGALMQQAESLGIKDKVSFAGYSENVIAEINVADVYVLSSRFEGSPNALVEAMCVNTPVIAFDCPHGPKEILQNGQVAPLVKYMDVNALAQTVVNTINVKEIVNYADAISRYDSKNAADAYRNMLLKR